MKRIRLTPGQAQTVLQQLLNHFRAAPQLVALNSNRQDGLHLPAAYTQFDWQLAVGFGEVFSPGQACFDQLLAQIDKQPDYYFGWLTYDLKNELEQLHSAHPDGLAFAPMQFFRPSLLLRCMDDELLILRDETDAPGSWASALQQVLPASPSLPRISFRRRVSDATYLQNVAAIREHIAAGTVYELNYCMEWFAEQVQIDPFETYRHLNAKTQAPFSVFLKSNDRYLLSGSPERFLRKEGQHLLTQPIKGTIQRASDEAADAALKKQLQQDEKERAENLMIVDLVRNDLSRSCEAGSVQVPDLLQVYSFRTVHQLISSVVGQLKPEVSGVTALRNAFPMGSMTGAPKIKAMELIEALESSKRGLYSGAVGYFHPSGDFDFNVVIRSLQYRADTGYLSLMTGSAITYDSVPERELAECELKAAALLRLFA